MHICALLESVVKLSTTNSEVATYNWGVLKTVR